MIFFKSQPRHRWKTTFSKRQPLIEYYLQWNRTFAGRWPSIKEDFWLWWKATFHGRQHCIKILFHGKHLVEDEILLKRTYDGRQWCMFPVLFYFCRLLIPEADFINGTTVLWFIKLIQLLIDLVYLLWLLVNFASKHQLSECQLWKAPCLTAGQIRTKMSKELYIELKYCLDQPGKYGVLKYYETSTNMNKLHMGKQNYISKDSFLSFPIFLSLSLSPTPSSLSIPISLFHLSPLLYSYPVIHIPLFLSLYPYPLIRIPLNMFLYSYTFILFHLSLSF